MVLNPNSSGQETAKARTQTTAIIRNTLFLERWVVLYKTGITTAVYLPREPRLLSAASAEAVQQRGMHSEKACEI